MVRLRQRGADIGDGSSWVGEGDMCPWRANVPDLYFANVVVVVVGFYGRANNQPVDKFAASRVDLGRGAMTRSAASRRRLHNGRLRPVVARSALVITPSLCLPASRADRCRAGSRSMAAGRAGVVWDRRVSDRTIVPRPGRLLPPPQKT